MDTNKKHDETMIGVEVIHRIYDEVMGLSRAGFLAFIGTLIELRYDEHDNETPEEAFRILSDTWKDAKIIRSILKALEAHMKD